MFGIVQGDESAISLGPQASIGVSMKHLDFFARLIQRIGTAAIGPATQKASARPRALPLTAGTQRMLESTAHQGMRIDDRDRTCPAHTLQQAQIDQLVELFWKPIPGSLSQGRICSLPYLMQQ